MMHLRLPTPRQHPVCFRRETIGGAHFHLSYLCRQDVVLHLCKPCFYVFVYFPTASQVSTDIVHFLSKKLQYYKGDYDTFVNVRTELAKNQRRAYEASSAKKAHMQEFIDKFRSNAKRASLVQSRIKVG